MLTYAGLAVRYGSLEEAHELIGSLRAVYRPPLLQVLTYAHICLRMLTYAHVLRAAFLQGLEALRAGQGAAALQARPAQIRDVLQVRKMCIR